MLNITAWHFQTWGSKETDFPISSSVGHTAHSAQVETRKHRRSFTFETSAFLMLVLDTCMLWKEEATRANLSLLLRDSVTRAIFLSWTLLLRLLSLLFLLVLQAWTWHVLSWSLPLRKCLHLGQNRLQEGRDVNGFIDFGDHTLSGSTNVSGLLYLSVTVLYFQGEGFRAAMTSWMAALYFHECWL